MPPHIPYRSRNPASILLDRHTQKTLSDPDLTMRSFSMTADTISICASREIPEVECTGTVGIDRNLRNVTCCNAGTITFHKTSKLLSIKENTSHARAAFCRNDRRKKGQFWKERQTRVGRRTKQYLHRISRDIVDRAVREKTVIVLENLRWIRKLYWRGNNGQGRKYRRRLNRWQFYELQRQTEYKSGWAGLPVEFVDPRHTSISVRDAERDSKGTRDTGKRCCAAIADCSWTAT